MKPILLVEDNSDDIFFHKMACQRTGIHHPVSVVTDGQAAIDYLSGSGPYSDRSLHPFPRIVFLDINLPKRNGHEVLQWARSQPALKILPIVMLTTSDDPTDIARAYQLGATSYSLKQPNLAQFGETLRTILKYWFELTLMPR
jgi:CheY-like chemotaxis protein